MPRYTFHFTDRNRCRTGSEEVPLPDEEAVWYQAVRSARELALGGSLGLTVEVEDELGARIFAMGVDDIAQLAS